MALFLLEKSSSGYKKRRKAPFWIRFADPP